MHRLPPLASLGAVLQAAMRVDGAVGGTIQVVDNRRHELHLIEERGLTREYSDAFRTVSSEYTTSCAQASIERRRVVIRDMRADDAFAAHRELAARAGFVAMQSTPLIDDNRHIHGVLSTYFAQPHHPAPPSLGLLDCCCRVATLVLQCQALHRAAIVADRDLGIHTDELPPAAGNAADVARLLLPTLDAANDAPVLTVVARNLEVVVREVSNRLQQTAGRGRSSAR